MDNPFFNRDTIADPAYFCGRPAEIADLMGCLQNRQSVSVIGAEKIGKSSLLRHVSRDPVLAQAGLDPAEFVFVHLSFGTLLDATQGGFFQLLIQSLQRQNEGKLAGLGLELPEPSAEVEFPEFCRVIEDLIDAGKYVVCVFDEFELSQHNASFDLDFFAGLRAIGTEQGVSYLTATRRLLHEEVFTKEFLGSAFHNIFLSVPLSVFAGGEAEEMIERLTWASGIDLLQDRDFIFELAGAYPYFLQVACYHLYHLRTQKSLLGDDDYRQVREQFLDEATPQFGEFWSFLWDEEKTALGRIACDEELGDVGPETMKRLRLLSLVSEDSGRAQIFSSAFADFARSAFRPYPDIVALVSAQEAKDRYIKGHSDGVARCAVAIAQGLGLGQREVEALRIAARLHDVGKIGIPNDILLNKGRLSGSQWDIMRKHPVIGAEIVGALNVPAEVRGYVRHHQERLDDSGYPDGLGGDRIPLGARILAVADVFNALTTPRVYRHNGKFSAEDALAMMREGKGTQFDVAALDALHRLVASRKHLQW